MKTYTIDNKSYYFGNDILADRKFSKGIKTVRDIIRRKKIDDKDYCYAKWNKDEEIWELSSGTSKAYDKVFIRKRYYDQVKDEPKPVKEKKKKKRIDVKKCHVAPKKIKFKTNGDKNKNLEKLFSNIQTRGKLTFDGIYFFLRDIGKKFGIHNLSNTITQDNSNYYPNIDYVYFFVGDTKRIYLTYYGLFHYAFNSKNDDLKTASQWIMQTMFTLTSGKDMDLQALIKSFSTGMPAPLARITLYNIPGIYNLLIKSELSDKILNIYSCGRYNICEEYEYTQEKIVKNIFINLILFN